MVASALNRSPEVSAITIGQPVPDRSSYCNSTTKKLKVETPVKV